MLIKKNETAIITVVYKKINKYLPHFINSLKLQSNKNFDLLIANDGIPEVEKKFYGSRLNYKIITLNETPIEIRRRIINEALRNEYKNIIFIDADDICEINRVEIVLNLLQKNPIIVNDIDLINENGLMINRNYFSYRFKNKDIVEQKDIIHSNIFGLTNTAAISNVFNNLKILKNNNPSGNHEFIAFDWILWTSALGAGYKAIFTNETSTKYRIYDQNIIGFPEFIDDSKLQIGIDVKLSHYNYFKNINKLYCQQFNKMTKIKNKSQSKDWKINYLKTINTRLSKQQLWWEFILTSI